MDCVVVVVEDVVVEDCVVVVVEDVVIEDCVVVVVEDVAGIVVVGEIMLLHFSALLLDVA